MGNKRNHTHSSHIHQIQVFEKILESSGLQNARRGPLTAKGGPKNLTIGIDLDDRGHSLVIQCGSDGWQVLYAPLPPADERDLASIVGEILRRCWDSSIRVGDLGKLAIVRRGVLNKKDLEARLASRAPRPTTKSVHPKRRSDNMQMHILEADNSEAQPLDTPQEGACSAKTAEAPRRIPAREWPRVWDALRAYAAERCARPERTGKGYFLLNEGVSVVLRDHPEIRMHSSTIPSFMTRAKKLGLLQLLGSSRRPAWVVANERWDGSRVGAPLEPSLDGVMGNSPLRTVLSVLRAGGDTFSVIRKIFPASGPDPASEIQKISEEAGCATEEISARAKSESDLVSRAALLLERHLEYLKDMAGLLDDR